MSRPDPAPAEPAASPADDPRPPLVVGWIVAADLRDEALLAAYEEARRRLLAELSERFGEFRWEMPLIVRRVHPPRGALRPLPLLELAGEEKLRRRWDFALAVVPNELEPRHRISTLGVPSSALESAVMSSAQLGPAAELPERLAALAQHLLGHLWTLETSETGPMRPPLPEELRLEPFPPDEERVVLELLRDATDARLEETRRRWSVPAFYLRAFLADPDGILKSIAGYRPWLLPLQLGRLTAAVAVSLLFLLLTAESWEAGTHVAGWAALGGPFVAVAVATAFVFFGQNLDQVGRGRGRSEQLARSHLVLFGTLLVGMVSLYAVMFALLWALSFALPVGVVAGWSGFEPAELPRLRFISFLATIGLLAAALGGNLEEEDQFKAELFYDEEV